MNTMENEHPEKQQKTTQMGKLLSFLQLKSFLVKTQEENF